MDYLIRAHGDTVADLANDGTLPAPRTENTAPQSLGGTTDSRTAH
ncbi:MULTISPECIES: hypothetical protein [unclassified Streptomyces]|nr:MULTISPECIES: hypothetical protein [unclassified Streptomyces]